MRRGTVPTLSVWPPFLLMMLVNPVHWHRPLTKSIDQSIITLALRKSQSREVPSQTFVFGVCHRLNIANSQYEEE